MNNYDINNFVLIIGSMKCGTTSLFSYLAQHPEVSACTTKEPNFFANDLNWSKGFDYYKSLWNWDSSAHKIALEASTAYTRIPKFPNAAERIAQTQADFKFIYLVRNPIERIESHYTHGKQSRWKTAKKPLDRGIHEELINVSRYAKQLDEYHQRFSSDRILLINFEDLKQKPSSTMKKVTDFLDIDPSFEFQNLSQVYNSTGERSIYPRWTDWIEPFAKYVPDEPKNIARKIVGKKVGSNVRLSLEQKKYVLQELNEDFQRLEGEYGFDVSRWKIKI